MKTAFLKNSALAAVTAFAMLGTSVQSSSAMPLDVKTLTSATNAPAVQTVGWTTKQKQAAGWGLAAGVLTGALVAGAINKKKKKNAMNLHIAYCAGKFQTYDPNTNMYMSTTGPKYCASPYL